MMLSPFMWVRSPVLARVLLALLLMSLLALWCGARAWWAWQAWLPTSQDGVEQAVVVQLLDFPARRDDNWQADVQVDGWRGKVRLSFPIDEMPALDCRYHVRAKLKRPRGFDNPGLFDYQLWLLQAGYVATGRVRTLTVCEPVVPSYLLQWRSNIAQRIHRAVLDERSRSTLLALTIGSYAGIDAAQWQLLRDSGTIHILSVSGLHIVLVSMLAYGLFSGLARLLVFPLHVAPSAHWGSVAAIVFAVFYALLADFSVATQRSLIMVAAVACQRLCCSRFRWLWSWWCALWLVLLWDPLSVLGCGFWFSFLATLVLLSVHHGVQHHVSAWYRYAVTNGMLFIVMAPMTLYLYGALPWLTLLANAIAVPVITFVSMPLAFLAMLAMPMESWSQVLFAWSGKSLGVYWWLIEHLLEVITLPKRWQWGGISLFATVLATVGTLLLLLPRGFPGKRFAAVLCLPLLFPAAPVLQAGEMTLTVLDAGQGLATVIRTARHTLVYDAGARFTSRFDSGRDIVAAHLHQQRLSHVDLLMVSHSDADHAGGVAGLVSALPVRQIWSGTPERLRAVAASPCRSGMHWRWDGVDFRVLGPLPSGPDRDTNNRSCILQVTNGLHRFLLPGDGETAAETAAVAAHGSYLKSDVLVAPHHGSKTSSTPALLQAVSPSQVLISAGHLNRFHHPHPAVIQRYEAAGIAWHATAAEGALQASSVAGELRITSAVCQSFWPWRVARGCGRDGL